MYSGTLVIRGEGLAIVRATGPRSELGRIGQALRRIATEPPRLQTETRQLVRVFAAFGIAASLLVILLYGLVHGDWLQAVLGGIALGMSMLPEEFPAGPDRLHGHGRLAAVAGARADAPRRRHRDAGCGHGPVHRQDRDPHRKSHDGRRASLAGGANGGARKLALSPMCWRSCSRSRCLPVRAQPSEPMEKAIAELVALRPGGLAALQAGKSMVRRYGLRPDLLAMTNVWTR